MFLFRAKQFHILFAKHLQCAMHIRDNWDWRPTKYSIFTAQTMHVKNFKCQIYDHFHTILKGIYCMPFLQSKQQSEPRELVLEKKNQNPIFCNVFCNHKSVPFSMNFVSIQLKLCKKFGWIAYFGTFIKIKSYSTPFLLTFLS